MTDEMRLAFNKNLRERIKFLEGELAKAKAEVHYIGVYESVCAERDEYRKQLEDGEWKVEAHLKAELKRANGEIERVTDVCKALNREKNTTFDQSCKNRNEADALKLIAESYRDIIAGLLMYIDRPDTGDRTRDEKWFEQCMANIKRARASLDGGET